MDFKIYKHGIPRPLAATVHAEDAAAVVALFGDGSTVKVAGVLVWTEGAEEISASKSYDHAGKIMRSRGWHPDTRGSE